jgi:hypothetical protein
LARGGNLARDLDRRVKCGLDVDVDERFEEGVIAPVLMQERRVRQARRKHIVHGRQLLQIDLDACGDILGLGPRLADAHRDELAHLSHLLVRKHRLLRRLEAREAGHSDDWLHANKIRGCECLTAMLIRNVDGAQLCVGERRADEGDIFHSREADIADKLASSA